MKQTEEVGRLASKELHPLLIEFPRTIEQVSILAQFQDRALGHDSKVLKYMEDNTSIKDPLHEERQAFKNIWAVIAYCEQFTDPEAYVAVQALKAVKLPLATSKRRYKKQQMITWLKEDYNKKLIDFTNKRGIVSALITLAKNPQ